MKFKGITVGTYISNKRKLDTLKQILGHKDISVTMKYYVDVDGSFIESETDNAIQYLVDKNIFGVELPQANVA